MLLLCVYKSVFVSISVNVNADTTPPNSTRRDAWDGVNGRDFFLRTYHDGRGLCDFANLLILLHDLLYAGLHVESTQATFSI